MSLSKDQVTRYSRQLILPQIGVAGQERLQQASVLMIGAGGLGSPAALYLAAAGVGTIGILDREDVALSNLHRQIMHRTADLGVPKCASAARQLQALNPEVRIRAIHDELSVANAQTVLTDYDLVLDGSDNVPTRYLVNDACVLLKKPFVYGGAIEFGGQVLTILPRQSACLRCVFPELPQAGVIPSCQDAGVLGSAVGLIGSLMAHEALKFFLGVGALLVDRLFVFEGMESRVRMVRVRRDPACAACGDHPSIHDLVTIDETTCMGTQLSALG